MSNTTLNYSLPFILASQTQKHITFNELANRVDALIMPSVISHNINTPPTNPQEGQSYIVGNTPLGDWQNNADKIAVWQNLGWNYITPKNGFQVFVSSESQFYIYNNGWVKFSNIIGQNPNFAKLGIGLEPDDINLFSVKTNSAFFSAKNIADGGDGNLRLKLNKDNLNNTASFIFQQNWLGRAEFGLCGDDNFSLKTSADGIVWKTAITVDTTTNVLKFGNPIDFPADLSASRNDIIKVNGASFLNQAHATGSDGYNTFMGQNCGGSNLAINSAASDASYNTGLGFGSLHALTHGNFNSSLGTYSLYNNGTGRTNTSIGAYSLYCNTSGEGNSGIGHNSLFNNITGSNNVAVGSYSLSQNTSGNYNTAVGNFALLWKTDGTNNVNFSNCCGIGNGARVSGSNQIQLGDSSTTAYVYGAIQNRSDARDKSDIRDTALGLEFIKALRPVDFKWNFRDDYFNQEILQAQDGEEQIRLVSTKRDNSKKRSRYHHGLIAQEVKAVIEGMNIDFGGFQDHSISGGSDVMSIGYSELIAPLIKAVQELSDRIDLHLR